MGKKKVFLIGWFLVVLLVGAIKPVWAQAAAIASNDRLQMKMQGQENSQTDTLSNTSTDTDTATDTGTDTGTDTSTDNGTDTALAWLNDLDELEEAVQAVINPELHFSFRELLSELAVGDFSSAVNMITTLVKEQLISGIYENQMMLFKIAALAALGAVFTNFSMAFSKEQTAETGFYLTYILMMTLLMASFMLVADIVGDTLRAMGSFMKVLLPAFCVTLTMTTGGLLAGGYYALMMGAIAVSDWLMAAIVMRLIKVYILTAMVNHITKEDYLSKLSELLELLIRWSVRTLVGVVLGMNMLQSMLLPAIDRAKSTMLYKMVSAVPGVGNAMNAAAGAVIGSGVLIRNVLGTGSLIVILVLCLVPIAKVCIAFLSYKLVQAIIQPVSDERLIGGIDAMTHGIGMLLQILMGCLLMFVLSMAIVCNVASILST